MRRSSCPSPSGTYGLILRTEPTLPLGHRDYRLGVPTTIWHVIDTIAFGTDVALNSAVISLVVGEAFGR